MTSTQDVEIKQSAVVHVDDAKNQATPVQVRHQIPEHLYPPTRIVYLQNPPPPFYHNAPPPPHASHLASFLHTPSQTSTPQVEAYFGGHAPIMVHVNHTESGLQKYPTLHQQHQNLASLSMRAQPMQPMPPSHFYMPVNVSYQSQQATIAPGMGTFFEKY